MRAGGGYRSAPIGHRRDVDDDLNLNRYYRGLAGQQIQGLADHLLALSREAEAADAHDAAWHLADLSTQLLDLGMEVAGQVTPRGEARSGEAAAQPVRRPGQSAEVSAADSA